MPFLPGGELPRAIGGVFAAETPGAESPDARKPCDAGEGEGTRSLWDHWHGDAAQVLTFRNARSALAYLLARLAPPRLWLPAYCCPDLAAAARVTGTPLHLYGGSTALQADTEALKRALRPGDLVVAVAHFGRPSPGLRGLAATRPDVIWAEDCVQAIDTAETLWASFRFYSPRKVLGVADGGLLIDRDGILPLPGPQRAAASARLRHAGLLRRHDPGDKRNPVWYAAFRRAEALMEVSDHAMSGSSLGLLRSTPLEPLRHRRRQNYAHLHQALGALALWADPAPHWTPFGFPIRVVDAAALGTALARHRVFAPRHWARLASDTPPLAERDLSRQLLTLPCDQRYGAAEMDRLIATLQVCLP